MNRITKVLSSLVAAVTLAVSVGSVASAITYDPCDVNHDGVVNVRDAATVKKFLVGNLCEPEYNRLDTNKSLTVDDQDYQCIMAKVRGKLYNSKYYSRHHKTTSVAPSVSSYTYDYSVNMLNARKYVKYNYNTHSISNYNLYPSTNMVLNTTSKKNVLKSVIEPDDRYIATGEENNGIVRIGAKGTGFIVGDHQIATAAHCLYNALSNSWCKNMSVECYDDNGCLNNNCLTPVEAHIPYNYVYNWGLENGTHTLYDYGLITVEEDLSDYVHFSLGTSYNISEYAYSNIPVYVTGCPDSVNNQNNSSNDLYSGEGRILGYHNLQLENGEQYNDCLLKYDVDVSSGNSGGPVYTITRNIINGSISYTYTALGINAYSGGTYNFGNCITKYQLQFYNEDTNIYMNY